MTNRMKAKGDRAEREALAHFVDAYPHLLRANAMRQLGAGRADDIGDLAVIDDVVIQVKACNPNNVVTRLRLAAHGAQRQQANADSRFAFGLLKYPGARPGSVRWVVAALDWPGGDPHAVFDVGSATSKALTFVRDDSTAVRAERIAVARGRGLPKMWVAPLEAWIRGYEAAVHTLITA